MMTVMGIYAEKNGIDMKGTEAEVQKIMSTEGPRRIAGIKVDMVIRLAKETDEKEKTILERIARTCPVSLSLHPDIQQDIRIRFETLQ